MELWKVVGDKRRRKKNERAGKDIMEKQTN